MIRKNNKREECHLKKLCLLVASTVLLCIGGCSSDESRTAPQEGEVARPVQLSASEAEALTAQYEKQRKAKDASFLNDPDSPLADEFRPRFQGLSYYPVDLRYRFRGPIHRLAKAERFQIMSTSGELRDAIHWGYFRFSLDGRQVHTLQVYKMLDLDAEYRNSLFMPFMDSRTGRETYGAGRYLDIEESPDGIYTIDFNAAYNPSCAYGKAYSCPITPRENRLKTTIPVGEKSLSHP